MERPAGVNEAIWDTYIGVYNAVPAHRRTVDIPIDNAAANRAIQGMLPWLLDLRAATAAAAPAPAPAADGASYKLFDVKDVPEWKGKDQVIPWLRGFRDFCSGYSVRPADVQAAIFRCKARITAEPSGSWFQETDAATFVRNDEDGNPEWGASWLALSQHLGDLLLPKDWYEKAAEAWVRLKQTEGLNRAEDFTDYKTRFINGLNKYNAARRHHSFDNLPQHETTMKFVECLPPGVYDEVSLKHSDILSRPWNHYDRDFTVAWTKVKGHKAMVLQGRAEEAETMAAHVRQVARQIFEEAEADFVPRRKTPARVGGNCPAKWDIGPVHLRGPLTVWDGMPRDLYDRVVRIHQTLMKEDRCGTCRRKRSEHTPITLFTKPKALDKVSVRQGQAEEEPGQEENPDPSEENS